MRQSFTSTSVLLEPSEVRRSTAHGRRCASIRSSLRRIYRVATKIADLTNGQSPPLTEYYSARPELLPQERDKLINIQHALMAAFARDLWFRIWENIAKYSPSGCIGEEDMKQLDPDGNGSLSLVEIFEELRDIGLKVDEHEMTLARCVFEILDLNRDGKVTMRDLKEFADQEGLCTISWDDLEN